MVFDVFDEVLEFAHQNHYVGVDDGKLHVMICSIGAHLFNTANKCARCDFDPADDENDFVILNCPLRHTNTPDNPGMFYTPMSHLPDTRIHILIEGEKGSGKNVLLDLFLAEGTGLLYSSEWMNGVGLRTMFGPGSITEAGMFGSLNEHGEITGRPLAREMCGGILAFEEISSLWISNRKDHSTDMINQLLTSLDSGRVNKGLKAGWVNYLTRYTVWGGTQPARLELESGLDRRFFIIQIKMNPERELAYKRAQAIQARMDIPTRVALADKAMKIRGWFHKRIQDTLDKPLTGVVFDDRLDEWIERPDVRNFESDLFRRLAIGYSMMDHTWNGGVLIVKFDDRLKWLLEQSLNMRRDVMDADMRLIKDTFWGKDMPKSELLKEIARMVTGNDYQAAKRWVEENMEGSDWYYEFRPEKSGKRGRRGTVCRIGAFIEGEAKTLEWGGVE